jgi:RHS repeat-associated protein
MPEFQTPAQLVKWRAETTAKTVAKEAAQAASSRLSTVDSSTFSLNSGVPTPLAPPQGSGAARSSQSNQLPPVAGFYTGKPYLAESGSYAFKYREYNPEMNRWTTVDPSGFPDGANNRLYAAVPTSEFDNNGLDTTSIYVPGTSASLTVSNNGIKVQIDIDGTSVENTTLDNMPVSYTGSVLAKVSVEPTGLGADFSGSLTVVLNPTVRPSYTCVLYLWAKESNGKLTEGLGARTYE